MEWVIYNLLWIASTPQERFPPACHKVSFSPDQPDCYKTLLLSLLLGKVRFYTS